MGFGTFLIRASVIYMAGRISISDRLKEIFTFIPSAILPALVAPMVFFSKGEVSALLYKERVVALLIAVFIAYKSKNILVTIIVGLAVLYCLKLI